MPSKKRRRDASRQPAPKTEAQRHSLEGFHLLPFELQHLIISLACLVPASSSTCLTPFSTDSATAFNLCLVNRELRSQVQHLLYKEVSITRPSQLYALQQTLDAHPERGELIERLHIGPQDVLPSYWWPLINAYVDGFGHDQPDEDGYGGPFTWITTSLDQAQLPSGFGDRQCWALDRYPVTCREAAILDAVDSAANNPYVDLSKKESTRPTNIERILEIQAALDLYLIKIRAMEDKNPRLARVGYEDGRFPPRCKNSNCGHYPELVLESASHSGANDSSQEDLGLPCRAYSLSRHQLLHHIARPGALTDRFDHPLLLSRSGVNIYLTVPPGPGHPDQDGSETRYTIRNRPARREPSRHLDYWPELIFLKFEDQRATLTPGRKPPHAALISTCTTWSNLRLAQSVLSCTPHLKGLSLSGFLTSAVGAVGSPKLECLRRLSLGPPPVCWKADASLYELKEVENLRLAGMGLDLAAVLNNLIRMPRLKRLELSLKEELSSSNTAHFGIVKTIQLLLEHDNNDHSDFPRSSTITPSSTSSSPAGKGAGMGEESTSPASAHGSSSLPSCQESTAHEKKTAASFSSSPSPAAAREPLLIVARLHPADFARVVAAAPTEEVRQAWSEGRATSAPWPSSISTLLLLRQREVEAGCTKGSAAGLLPSQDSTSHVWDEFYEEGREWWSAGEAR